MAPFHTRREGINECRAWLCRQRVNARIVSFTKLSFWFCCVGDVFCVLICQEFQSILGANQASMDGTIKIGKALMDKSPQDDSIMIEGKIADLKARWDAICALSVERLVII